MIPEGVIKPGGSWSYDHVTVFLKNGVTLRFNEVTGYGCNGQLACFEYTSASGVDGRNAATLYCENVAMIAGANGRYVAPEQTTLEI